MRNIRFDDNRLIRYAASYGLTPAFEYLRDEVGLDPTSNSREAFVLACQSGHIDLAKMIGVEWAQRRDNSATQPNASQTSVFHHNNDQLDTVHMLSHSYHLQSNHRNRLGMEKGKTIVLLKD